MLKEGDFVTIGKYRYALGKKIGGGLEGNVFDLASSNRPDFDCSKFVIKVINSANFTDEQYRTVYRRINTLKELGATNKELKKRMSLPQGLLGGDNLGYVMKKMKDGESLKKYLDPQDQDFKEWYRDRYTLNSRYNLIAGIFDSLREIHINGLIFTDLSPNNIMVKTSKNGYIVYFIDTDNLRSKDDPYSGVLGTPGYMAPEIYRKEVPEKIGEYDRTRKGTPVKDILSKVGRNSTDSDIFSAAIIAFQLLTLHHPFVGDEIDSGSPEDEERAYRIETDYIFKEGTSNTSSAHLVPAFEQLTTPKIRELFRRTFVDGKEEPTLRPTDLEFHEAFLAAKDDMTVCPECGFTTIYSKAGTPCLGCDKPLGPLPVLSINQVFSNLTPEDVLSKKIPERDDHKSDDICKKYRISRVVLTPDDEKNLYLRNFEQRTDRGTEIATVEVSNDKMVNMKMFSDRYPQTSIISIKTGNRKPFSSSKQQFNPEGHKILFEETQGSDSTIYCRLEGEFTWE